MDVAIRGVKTNNVSLNRDTYPFTYFNLKDDIQDADYRTGTG